VTGILLVLACVAGPSAQADEPTLRLVEPQPGAALRGAVTLRAELLPAEAAASVLRLTFSADGRTVCRRGGPPLECSWDAGSRPAAHDITASVLLSDGRLLSASVTTRGLVPLDPVGVDVVYLAATVTDGDGRAVPGLGPEAFSVREDAAPQTLSHFLGPDAPRELVVAIDISSSMAEAMPQVRRAVKSFLAAVRPTDRVTLLAFNDDVFTAAPRDADAPARQAAASRLAAWGGTSLYDVVLHALGLLSAQKGRKGLVVFTDGRDQSSRATLHDVERRAARSDVPMYFVAQGQGTREVELKEVLERLGRLSGGRAFFTSRPERLEQAFADIVRDFEGQYLLGYEPRAVTQDGSWRRITVEAGPGRHVRAREGYRAEPLRR
jgi:VWFA-related protein